MKIFGFEIPSISVSWGTPGDRLWWQRCDRPKLSGKTYFLLAVLWKDMMCVDNDKPGVTGRYRGLEFFVGPLKFTIHRIEVQSCTN